MVLVVVLLRSPLRSTALSRYCRQVQRSMLSGQMGRSTRQKCWVSMLLPAMWWVKFLIEVVCQSLFCLATTNTGVFAGCGRWRREKDHFWRWGYLLRSTETAKKSSQQSSSKFAVYPQRSLHGVYYTYLEAEKVSLCGQVTIYYILAAVSMYIIYVSVNVA